MYVFICRAIKCILCGFFVSDFYVCIYVAFVMYFVLGNILFNRTLIWMHPDLGSPNTSAPCAITKKP